MERCFVWLTCSAIIAFFWYTLTNKETEKVSIGIKESQDQNLQVAICNLPPMSNIVVQARLKGRDGTTLFATQGAFQADSHGDIELYLQNPYEPSSNSAKTIGLFWNKKDDPKECASRQVDMDGAITISFSVSLDGGVILAYKSIMLNDPVVEAKFAALHREP